MLLHDPLDILHNDDGVINDNADGEHDGEKRDRVGGIADGLERDEGPDQADRHRKGRDQRRAYAPEEKEDHDDHEDEGLDQRFLHLLNGCRHEAGRVDVIFQARSSGKRFSISLILSRTAFSVAIAFAPGVW